MAFQCLKFDYLVIRDFFLIKGIAMDQLIDFLAGSRPSNNHAPSFRYLRPEHEHPSGVTRLIKKLPMYGSCARQIFIRTGMFDQNKIHVRMYRARTIPLSRTWRS
jgi:hypothetical protein